MIEYTYKNLMQHRFVAHVVKELKNLKFDIYLLWSDNLSTLLESAIKKRILSKGFANLEAQTVLSIYYMI